MGADSSEYVRSYLVVVPGGAAGEASFLSTYETLAAGAVPYGPEGRREELRGSPVVPGSARRLAADREGYALFALAALCKYDGELRAALKERKLTLREHAYAPAAAAAAARAAEELAGETAAALAQLRDAAQRKLGELLALALHVKAVRLFVDAVLRYGLPTGGGGGGGGDSRCPYAAVLVVSARGKQRAVLEAVRAAWASIGSAEARASLERVYGEGGAAGGGGQGAGSDPVIPGVTDTGAAGLPFVLLDFDVRPDTNTVLGAGR